MRRTRCCACRISICRRRVGTYAICIRRGLRPVLDIKQRIQLLRVHAGHEVLVRIDPYQHLMTRVDPKQLNALFDVENGAKAATNANRVGADPAAADANAARAASGAAHTNPARGVPNAAASNTAASKTAAAKGTTAA